MALLFVSIILIIILLKDIYTKARNYKGKRQAKKSKKGGGVFSSLDNLTEFIEETEEEGDS